MQLLTATRRLVFSCSLSKKEMEENADDKPYHKMWWKFFFSLI